MVPSGGDGEPPVRRPPRSGGEGCPILEAACPFRPLYRVLPLLSQQALVGLSFLKAPTLLRCMDCLPLQEIFPALNNINIIMLYF